MLASIIPCCFLDRRISCDEKQRLRGNSALCTLQGYGLHQLPISSQLLPDLAQQTTSVMSIVIVVNILSLFEDIALFSIGMCSGSLNIVRK